MWFEGDSRNWSDGFRSNDAFYEITRITRCDVCYEYFWITEPIRNDLKDRQILMITLQKPEITDNEVFKTIRKLNVDEYAEALAMKKYHNPEDEMFIRTRLWWSINHPVRNSLREDIEPEMLALFEENLETLIYKTRPDGSAPLFLLAEMNRELGLFREAEKFLNQINDDSFAGPRAKMLGKITSRDKKVFLL
jgi:hypothetical protein